MITLTQTSEHITYDVTYSKDWSGTDDTHDLLVDYLNVKVDLHQLYQHWCKQDPHFLKIADQFRGIRMLRQDPLENLICFICSSNNNIARITQMVNNLCTTYGKFVAEVDGTSYFDFPSLDALQHDQLEAELRNLGFGYRAKFIASTAKSLGMLPVNYLVNLRQSSYEEARTALMSFMGVGAKVADCVALMSLDKSESVPVDTHVLQIAQRDYHIRTKSHEYIKKHFVELWGPYAGWAHSILFTADLKQFKVRASSKAMTKKEDDPNGMTVQPEDEERTMIIVKTEALDQVKSEPTSKSNSRLKRGAKPLDPIAAPMTTRRRRRSAGEAIASKLIKTEIDLK